MCLHVLRLVFRFNSNVKLVYFVYVYQIIERTYQTWVTARCSVKQILPASCVAYHGPYKNQRYRQLQPSANAKLDLFISIGDAKVNGCVNRKHYRAEPQTLKHTSMFYLICMFKQTYTVYTTKPLAYTKKAEIVCRLGRNRLGGICIQIIFQMQKYEINVCAQCNKMWCHVCLGFVCSVRLQLILVRPSGRNEQQLDLYLGIAGQHLYLEVLTSCGTFCNTFNIPWVENTNTVDEKNIKIPESGTLNS